MPIKGKNAEAIDAERALQELTARVFKGASESDLEEWLARYAEFCGAFSRHLHENQFNANVVAGRGQAFFWLADHLQLSLAVCYPRYLMSAPGPTQSDE